MDINPFLADTYHFDLGYFYVGEGDESITSPHTDFEKVKRKFEQDVDLGARDGNQSQDGIFFFFTSYL